jgi:hypothetical protein
MPKTASITFTHPPVDNPALCRVPAAGVPFAMSGAGK